MTTADKRPETESARPEAIESTERPDSSTETFDSTERAESPQNTGSAEWTGSLTETTGSAEGTGSATPNTSSSTAGTDTSADESLFAEGDRSSLRSRWDNVQSGFVDDPRRCVHNADGLVSDVVDQLTAGLSEARSRLKEQWARGEEVSTEDFRLTLKRYRELFERLLAV